MNTEKKAVFFDADGTICDMEKGVPDSALEAIRKLRENGHEAWLCTGRSRAFVPGYLEQIPFTGMISACGATIEKDGVRLYNNEMTPEVAKLSCIMIRTNIRWRSTGTVISLLRHLDRNGDRSEDMRILCISTRSVPR